MSEDSEPDPTAPRPERRSDVASEFLRARLELIRFEANAAGRQLGARIGFVALIAGGGFFAWCLLLAGLIGWISAVQPDWPWHYSALIAAGLHLLLALLALRGLTRPGPATFPLTRSELAKDREWLNQLQHPNKPRP